VRRRRSREEAARLVKEYEQSGLSRRAFCRQHGLSIGTLDNYRKLRSPDAGKTAFSSPSPSAISFIPVELIEHRPGASRQPGNGASLFVELASGLRVGVLSGFDAATLIRLIAVLEQE